MNFDDTTEEAAFRARARDWLTTNAPVELWDELSQSGFGHLDLRSVDSIAAARAWQRKKFDAGWAMLHLSREHGGAGATPIERVIWAEEEGIFGKLGDPFLVASFMCAPTIVAWAAEAVKSELLPRIATGENVWCQLFSEPVAGSDLAGIRTKAVRDGRDWVVNGQKIWTTYARDADWGLLLTRTDSSVFKHRGLTMFVVDMKSFGVEVRPIWQMNEESVFNEVYFTDVRIPDAQRLGDVGQGWTVALTTLMNERMFVGGSMPTGVPQLLDLCSTIETTSGPAIDNPHVRSQLAKFAVKARGLQYSAFRSLSALSRGEEPGPESSIIKLVAGQMMQDVARFALDLQGEVGLVQDPAHAPDRARFQEQLLRSPATRIEGGSDEILRNIIAERVLGLPADIRADKNIPFDEIPTAATAR